jgi:hypothetical protein
LDNNIREITDNMRSDETWERHKREVLCGIVVRVLGYRSGGPGSIPGTTRKK